MDEKFRKFSRDIYNHINSSDWLVEETGKLNIEIEYALENNMSDEHLNTLLDKADYLQGKINAEQNVYRSIVEEHKEFIL